MKRIFAILLITFSLINFTSYAQSNESVIFLIDSSGSMKGDKIESVRSAVREITSVLRSDIEVGIIKFDSKVDEIVPNTLNKSEVSFAIDGLKANGETSLYDAISAALDRKIQVGETRIIVLSDGEDTQSVTTLSNLIKKASQIGIPIDIIGLQVSQSQADILEQISKSSNGTFVLLSEIGELISVYKNLLGDRIIESTADEPKPIILNIVTNPVFEICISLFFGLLIMWLAMVIRNNLENRRMVVARLKAIQNYSSRRTRKAISRLRTAVTNYGFIPDKFENYMRKRLDFINSKYSYEMIVRVLLGIWLASILLFFAIFQNLPFALIIAFLMPPLIFQTVTNSIVKKQRNAFAEELPEMLNVVASGLRAGLSLQQGLEAYAGDSVSEVARQIRRATAEVRVGTPIDEALMAIAERMESEDLKWVITTLSIQRVVGGSMSTILMNTYETIRSRAEIRREVKTLAAEGKLSAIVLMILPIGIFFFLFLTRRQYVQAFWTDPLGVIMLIMVSIGMTVGWFWMKKIAEIKI